MNPSPRNDPNFTSHQWQDWFGLVTNELISNTITIVPTSGFTVTCPSSARVTNVLLNPSVGLTSGTVVFPTKPQQGDVLLIVSTQAVTTLTNTVPTGVTISGADTALTANTAVRYIFAGTNWFRA